MRIIKRILCTVLLAALLVILIPHIKLHIRFFRFSSPDAITFEGTEYTYLASEPTLYYLGELEFKTALEGEPEDFEHMLGSIETGLYSIKDAEADNILVRYMPDNEWYSIYRKSSLPPLDCTADNCSRLEFVPWKSAPSEDNVCTSSDEEIIDRVEIAEFFADIRSQKTPEEAGLYDYVRQPNGFFKNCYVAGAICGYFEEEPDVYIRMTVTSYNDQAYSIKLENKEYVLPEKWVKRLRVH